MSDSNNAVAAQAAPAQPQRPKTYVERIEEIEQLLATHDSELYNAKVTFDFTAKAVEDMLGSISDLAAQIKAVVTLLESGKPVSQQSVAENIMATRVSALEKTISEMAANGRITKTDTVTSNANVVVYKTESVPYGYSIVENFKEEVQTSVLGKKAGDSVKAGDGTLTILEVYTINAQGSDSSEKAEQAEANSQGQQ